VSKLEYNIICEECDSELVVDTKICPICGSVLEQWEVEGVDQKEIFIKKKIEKTYNMVYHAEHLDIDTMEANELIILARQELEVGDFHRAEDYITEAHEKIYEQLKDELKKEIEKAYKELKKADFSGVERSEVKKMVHKANHALKKGELNDCLALLEYLK